MAAEYRGIFPATAQGMFEANKAAEEFCIGRNIAQDLTSRVQIVIEELFSNTVKYGYGGECDRPVRLRLGADPNLTLVYEDDAQPFDPTAYRTGDPGPTPDNCHEGKAGIALLIGLSTSVIYRPRLDGNCLEMIFEEPADDQ
jgi:serine/threonine-protein kinase RsbW